LNYENAIKESKKHIEKVVKQANSITDNTFPVMIQSTFSSINFIQEVDFFRLYVLKNEIVNDESIYNNTLIANERITIKIEMW